MDGKHEKKSSWPKKNIKRAFKLFKGVKLSELPELEYMFSVNVYAYESLDENCLLMLYTNGTEYNETMHLLLYSRHFMYIKDFVSVATRFLCHNCKKLLNRYSNCRRHERSCANMTMEKFPSGFLYLPSTIFERLMEQVISVPDEDRFFSHFTCFDMEAILLKEKREVTEHLTWTHKHRAISVSVNSNVPGFTSPHCFIKS
jgi:hypothetical protein